MIGTKRKKHGALLLTGMLASGILSGCGMSQMTSSLGGGIFSSSKKQDSSWTPIVTEESMLAAARTNTSGPVDMAAVNGCPTFQVQSGERYVTYYEAGRVGDTLSVTHRGEITKTARECQVVEGQVVVKYGFAGRVLLGPKGKAGTLALPATIQVTDRAKNKLRSEPIKVVVSISKENPLSYFSLVRDVAIPIKPGTTPQDYVVVVSFDQTGAGAG
jgi:hypothetical protein